MSDLARLIAECLAKEYTKDERPYYINGRSYERDTLESFMETFPMDERIEQAPAIVYVGADGYNEVRFASIAEIADVVARYLNSTILFGGQVRNICNFCGLVHMYGES